MLGLCLQVHTAVHAVEGRSTGVVATSLSGGDGYVYIGDSECVCGTCRRAYQADHLGGHPGRAASLCWGVVWVVGWGLGWRAQIRGSGLARVLLAYPESRE